MMYALYHSGPSVRKIINSSLVAVAVFSIQYSAHLGLYYFGITNNPLIYPSHNHICTHRSSNTACFTMEIFFDLNYYNYFVLFIVFLIASIYLFKNKKNRPPGPFGLPILGHLYLFNGKPLPLSLKELSDRYGPIILLRFGSKPVLVVTSPSAVEECFTKNDVIFANRPPFICGNYLGYDFTTLEWAPYGNHWKNLRRITNIEIFSSISLQASSTIRNEEVRYFIRKLFKEYSPSSSVERFQTVDLTSKLYEMALVFIMKMVAGRRHFGDEKWSSDTVKETFLPTRLMSKVDFLPVLRLIGYQGTEKFMLNMRRKKDAFLDALLEEHRKGEINRDEQKKDKTMIDALLSLQKEDPDFYTDENIKGIIGVMFAAGVETSVTAMIWAMSLLLNHPEELAKLRTELDLHVEGRLLCDSDISKLPYLHCVINETLRLHPPAPITLPHQSSEECKVGGFDIPRGTTLIVNAWAIHRDPKLWVEAPRFMPERFESGKEEKEGFKWLAFGTGRRGCPGSGLAYRVVGLTIGTMVQCFDWKKAAEETLLMREEVEPYGSMYKPRQDKMNLLSNLIDN